MGLITDDVMKTQDEASAFVWTHGECLRCDERLSLISKENVQISKGWLCLDCSAIYRRGDTEAKDWKGKPVTFTEIELNARCQGKECQAEKSELEEVIDELFRACDGALLLRGIAAAVRDPLAFEAEKTMYRGRYKEIETQIRMAMQHARSINK